MGDTENLALGMLMSTEVPMVGSGSRGRHLQADKKEP